MKSENGEEGDVASLEDDEHWTIQLRFEDDGNDVEKQTVLKLDLFRNELSQCFMSSLDVTPGE